MSLESTMQHVRHAPVRKIRSARHDCMMALLEHAWKDSAAVLAASIRMAAEGEVLVDETEGQQLLAKVRWALSSERSLWGPDALCRRRF
jgi:hypothetical protein